MKKSLVGLLLLSLYSTQCYALWSDTLEACWSFNESAGSTRVDSIGGFNAADSGTVGSVAGVVGNAASFSGSTSQKLLTTAGMRTNLHFNLAHSVAFWIHPTDFTTNATINRWLMGDNNAGGTYFQFFIAMPGKTLEADNAGSFGCVNASTTVLTVNTTYFITLTDNGGANGCILYINAAVDHTVNSSFPVENEAATLAFGLNTGNTNNPFYGWMDEVMMFTSALSSSDVTTIYNAGAGKACVNKVTPHRSRILKREVPDLGMRLGKLFLPQSIQKALR
jgi:hypothetical protein